MKFSADTVRRLGPCVVFHLHSTGCKHFEQVLDVPGLGGLQITIEANGPPLVGLLPMFRKTLERSRLMIFADHRYEELASVLPRLPVEGLYLVVPQSFVASEVEYLGFLSAAGWRHK
jgi:hypothetical protein